MAVAGALLRAVWAEERDIADAARARPRRWPRSQLPIELPGRRAIAGRGRQRLDAAYSQHAIDASACSVRRATSIAGELFWGQDRLDFVQRRLARG